MVGIRVFISHAPVDDSFVAQIARNLRNIGLQTWVDHEELADDDAQAKAINAALDACAMMIVALSPAALESKQVQDEWRHVVRHNKPVIPVIVEPCAIPDDLQNYPCVDFSQGATFAQLVRVLGVSAPTQPLNPEALDRRLEKDRGLMPLDKMQDNSPAERPQTPFTAWARIAPREIVPGFHGRFVHTDGMTLSYWEVEEGTSLPEHAHPHEQITSLLEGRFEMTVGGETRILEPGDVAVIPSQVPHKGTALTPCRIMDVFQPARDDYR